MKEKILRFTSIICGICLLMSSVVALAEGVSTGDISGRTENRQEVLTIEVGDEADEVGYWGDENSGYRGPEALVVEDGMFYLLDYAHGHIAVFDVNGWLKNIDLEGCSKAQFMTFQDDLIGVVDNQNAVTGIYSTDGDRVALVEHPEVVDEEFILALSEIGNNYVVWKTAEGNYYHYNWEEESLHAESAENMYMDASLEAALANATSVVTENENLNISSEKARDALGVYQGSVIYEQYEYITDVDTFYGELSVRKCSADGQEEYAIIDYSEWYASSLSPFYASSEGATYVMENYADRVVISEVRFGTTDVSMMSELEQEASNRRMEMEQTVSLTGLTSAANGTLLKRTEVNARASEMANYTWTVLSNHKVVKTNTELPSYIENAAVGDEVTGIPYCWGGYNGIDTINSDSYAYMSFESVIDNTSYMAGDVACIGNAKQSGTIGLDCSGFVSSAYGVNWYPKKGTEYLYNEFGTSIELSAVKMGDFVVAFNGEEGHVMLIYTLSGTDIIVYESNRSQGKVLRNTYAMTHFSTYGYIAKTPYHLTCNANGGITVVGSAGHILVCGDCGYSRKVAHTYSSGTCTVCGYSK